MTGVSGVRFPFDAYVTFECEKTCRRRVSVHVRFYTCTLRGGGARRTGRQARRPRGKARNVVYTRRVELKALADEGGGGALVVAALDPRTLLVLDDDSLELGRARREGEHLSAELIHTPSRHDLLAAAHAE